MANFNIDYLIVAGGGGGAGGFGNGNGTGGGGAGGLITTTTYNGTESTFIAVTATPYSVEVGQGGAGGTGTGLNGSSTVNIGVNGSRSMFSITEAVGGGGGAGAITAGAVNGSSGGSGGGGGPYSRSGGSPTANQGNSGGTGSSNPGSVNRYRGGGGGGASQSGASGDASGNGGNGISYSTGTSSITGSAASYAGGGGGGVYSSGVIAGTGGLGGGGDGARTTGHGASGLNNTGGGGGGAGGEAYQNGGDGGSGVVILRYTTNTIDSYTTTGITPTEDTTTVPGQTILSFTTAGTGTITFTALPPPTVPFDGTRATTSVTGFESSVDIGLKLPSGTNANMPFGVQGMIRNNTEETIDNSASAIAHYNGTNWQYFAATESPDVVYPTSLKMYLDASDTTSYPGTGTTWFDLTSNANNGTINGATWNSGGYFTFDGSGDYINLAQNILSTTPIASFSLWAKGSTLATNTTQYKIIYNNANGGFFFALLVGSGNLEVYTRNSSAANIIPISYPVSNFNANDWYHITVTFSGLNSAVNLYVNSVLVDTGTFPTTTTVYTQYYNSVGGDPASGAAFTMVGSVSKVKTYNKTLTQAEVTALYNEGE
jgi:hypothetical protein